ncbi:MAG: DNA adenine methylase [Planctomycetales bacterium]|nr:DNA adenine methylase [bacterium]UNM09689.1 MAG: DNA adenine methylase [Planctomycetales bacterium]
MNVVIESDGFERIIYRYDSQSTLVYCDPPYLGTESVYAEGGEFRLDDHLALAKCLNLCQSKAAVSYFAHPLLEILYPFPKWNYSYLVRTCNLSRQKRRGNTRMEVLIRNYEN